MIEIREIRPEDNEVIASIIRNVMLSFNADPKTTILGDPTLNRMYENYDCQKAVYYIASLDEKIVGGCGIKKLDGGNDNTCELQRMFLLPEARGKKIGKQLMDLCINKALAFNYDRIYLESLKQMTAARTLYLQSGFREINQALGNTGHGGCDIYMIKDLEKENK